VSLILIVREVIFLKVENTSWAISMGPRLFDSQIVLSEAKGNFWIKKIEAPRKPREIAVYAFCQQTKNNVTIRIRGTLVFLCIPVRPYAFYFSFIVKLKWVGEARSAPFCVLMS
jgi:hypothetical protein